MSEIWSSIESATPDWQPWNLHESDFTARNGYFRTYLTTFNAAGRHDGAYVCLEVRRSPLDMFASHGIT